MRAYDAQPANADAHRIDVQRRLARVVLALQNYFVDREDCPQAGALLVQVGACGRAPARAVPDLDAHTGLPVLGGRRRRENSRLVRQHARRHLSPALHAQVWLPQRSDAGEEELVTKVRAPPPAAPRRAHRGALP
jgi:hypothetical protein